MHQRSPSIRRFVRSTIRQL